MGYCFHYNRQGNSQLPVVLFLHGFMGNGQDFDPIITQLSHQFCCLTVDLPGHGKTLVDGAPAQYTMPQTAQALIDWLDRLNVAHCFPVGYSMGGRLALYLSLTFPHRFPRTVLASASPGLHTAAERQARLQHDWHLATQLETDFPVFLRNWYDQPLFQSLCQHPAFQATVQRRLQNQPVPLATALRYLSTGQQPSLWEVLPDHPNPLLLLVGERDRKFCAINQQMVEVCPSAQLRIIPACGHVIHLEQPAHFIQCIRTFLAAASSTI